MQLVGPEPVRFITSTSNTSLKLNSVYEIVVIHFIHYIVTFHISIIPSRNQITTIRWQNTQNVQVFWSTTSLMIGTKIEKGKYAVTSISIPSGTRMHPNLESPMPWLLEYRPSSTFYEIVESMASSWDSPFGWVWWIETTIIVSESLFRYCSKILFSNTLSTRNTTKTKNSQWVISKRIANQRKTNILLFHTKHKYLIG